MNTIIEKIRAEIKIRLSANGAFDEEGDSAWHYDQGLNDAYNYILSVLSDLEKEEKPMNPNEDVFKIWGTTEKDYLDKSMEKVRLEMEIATYLKDWEEDEEIGLHLSTDNGCIPIELDDVRDLARHFYELGCRRTAEKYDEIEYKRQRADVCEGLEEAVVDYFEGYWPGMETAEQCNTDLHFTPPAIMRLARHFAKCGAEHLKR